MSHERYTFQPLMEYERPLVSVEHTLELNIQTITGAPESEQPLWLKLMRGQNSMEHEILECNEPNRHMLDMLYAKFDVDVEAAVNFDSTHIVPDTDNTPVTQKRSLRLLESLTQDVRFIEYRTEQPRASRFAVAVVKRSRS